MRRRVAKSKKFCECPPLCFHPPMPATSLETITRHCDRLLVLADGSVAADGPPKEVMTPEVLSRVFGVQAILGDDGDVPYAVPRGPA